jgi:hypothetical protein
MTGKLMPDLSSNEYISDIAGKFSQGRVVKIPATGGDKILFINSIPVNWAGSSSTLDALIDITSLELARRQEADANIAKSELLATNELRDTDTA